MNRLKYIFILGILLLISCEDEYHSSVPNISFRSYPIYLEDAEYVTFDVGSSIALDSIYGGYAGLILYYKASGVIYAYDRCCPRHVDDKELLELDGALAFCPSDSVYFPLMDGEPAIEIGNSTNPSILKSYKVSLNGNTLIVYN